MEKYVENALLTESKDFNRIRERLSDNRFRRMVFAKIVMAVYALNSLDMVKKHMFYGKVTPEFESELNSYIYAGNLPDGEIFDDRMIRTIHASMGIATEGGELLEAVLKVFNDPSVKLDDVNIFEENGDVEWYQAILADEYDFTLAQCQHANNVKLAKRFNLEGKMGFTEDSAINRDLDSERKILESGASDGLTRL